jgi:hypothetical protein
MLCTYKQNKGLARQTVTEDILGKEPKASASGNQAKQVM